MFVLHKGWTTPLSASKSGPSKGLAKIIFLEILKIVNLKALLFRQSLVKIE